MSVVGVTDRSITRILKALVNYPRRTFPSRENGPKKQQEKNQVIF